MPRFLLKRAQPRRASVVVALEGTFDEGDGPKWVQVTREGNFPGYMGGTQPFAFTRKDLDDMVANLKTHPSYKLEGGQPTGRVIPWDFNHASEYEATSGDLPLSGAPAQGWTLDMEVRNGADGKAELWALTQFLEPAKTYVKTGAYQWASVAVAFNAVHPETARNVGALVTSIALTNTPFVEGMEQLVASTSASDRQANAEKIKARRTWFEAARDATEVISMMRELFALPETAGATEIMMQVGIVRSWLETGMAPLGTDPEHIIGSMRIIMNLPALTPQLAVLDEAGKSIQALLQEQAAAAGVPASPTTQPTEQSVPEPEENDMDLIAALSKLLGVSPNEDKVKAAVTELCDLRTGLTEVLELSRDGNSVILAAAKEGSNAKEKLSALLKALGIEDVDGALNKIATTMEQAAQLSEVMPELEGLRADKAETEEKAVEADVDTAIAASNGKIDPSMRGALILQRKTDPEGFAAAFPKKPAQPQPKTQLLSKVASDGSAPLNNGKVDQGGSGVINLSRFEGQNPTARAKAYLSTTVSNWNQLTNDEKFDMARNLRARPDVIDQPEA